MELLLVCILNLRARQVIGIDEFFLNDEVTGRER
jgi:hypothetical protein